MLLYPYAFDVEPFLTVSLLALKHSCVFIGLSISADAVLLGVLDAD